MSNPDILRWQYQQVLGELQQVQLHASDPSCPCGLADIGEYCLAKHTLMVMSLSGETSAMDDANSQLWDDLQESATEMHQKTRDAMCNKNPYPDLITWSREWRKKIEPIYYACKAKARQEPYPDIKISGKCPDGDVGSCEFKVKPDAKAHKVDIHGLPEAIANATKSTIAPCDIHDIKARPLTVHLSGHDFKLSPALVRRMSQLANASKKREVSLAFCKDKDDILHPSTECMGTKCSVPVKYCPDRAKHGGNFHTHPDSIPSSAESAGYTNSNVQRSFSLGDLRTAHPDQVHCVSGPSTDVITCMALKPGRKPALVGNRHAYTFIHPDATEAEKENIRRMGRRFRPEGTSAFEFAEFDKMKLAQEPPAVSIRGSCKKDSCTYKVKATDTTEVETGSTGALSEAIEKVLQEATKKLEKPAKASRKTWAQGQNELTRYDFEYQVFEASNIIASHDPWTFELRKDYPHELQPRLRDRAATRVQVEKMAANLSPEALLSEFHALDRGSPIVGPDRIVESGNGRVMAIQRAIMDHPASYRSYRDALIAASAQFGIKPEGIEKMQAPILVRVRKSDVKRTAFVEEANAPAALSPSAIEQARTDARLITMEMLNTFTVGENESVEDAVRASRNRHITRQFLSHLSNQDQARLIDAHGALNQDGVKRITMALFVSAFAGDSGLKLAETSFESIDMEIRNVVNGISRALGRIAKAEAAIREGQRRADLSIGDDLAQAVTVLAQIQRTPGMTVEQYLSQGQMFERVLSPFQETVLKDISRRIRSAKRIGIMLSSYADYVLATPPPRQVSLIAGDIRTKEELWRMAARADEEAVHATVHDHAHHEHTEAAMRCRQYHAQMRQVRMMGPHMTDGLEHGYVICRTDDGDLLRGRETTGDRYNVDIDMHCPAGRPVGIFHTHPGGVPVPSTVDISEAQRWGVEKLCIGVPETGDLQCHRVPGR